MTKNNIISFTDFQDKKLKEKIEQPFPGILVWLYCPHCKTIEYSIVQSIHGRTHKCGNQVEEIEVEVDLRAEATIVQLNLQIIEELQKDNQLLQRKQLEKQLNHLLESLKSSEEKYLLKLEELAQTKIKIYPLEQDYFIKNLPIAGKNHFGILISDFRWNPEARFNAS